jgi:hypothetical protein
LVGFLGLAVAGCGSSSSGSSPLSSELSYFPTDSPFVLSIQTDPGSSAVQQGQQLLARFPIVAFGETAVMAKLTQLGINYSADIRPLFGNPVALGLGGTGLSGSARNEFLAVWITKDAAKLNSLLKKLLRGQPSSGSRDGASLYQLGTAAVATDGATIAVSSSMSTLQSALDRHAHGGGISGSDYSQNVAGLPKNSLVQVFGSLGALLSTPKAANARRIPWVAALRGYAASVSANSSGLTWQYRLDTTGTSLSASQLPIATGATAPGLAGDLPIVVALRDPAQVVSFVESAEQATNPSKYSQFLAREAAARRKTGADLTTLAGMLTGDLIAESDSRTTIIRAQVADPAAASSTLAKLSTSPQVFSSSATSATRAADGLYSINEPGHSTLVGVIGNQLVVGIRATAAQMTAFAAAPATPAPGAQGAVAFRVSLPALLQIALKTVPPKLVRSILSTLGDINGWTAAGTSGMTGSATLAVR